MRTNNLISGIFLTAAIIAGVMGLPAYAAILIIFALMVSGA